jgi:hypothetical protein
MARGVGSMLAIYNERLMHNSPARRGFSFFDVQTAVFQRRRPFRARREPEWTRP